MSKYYFVLFVFSIVVRLSIELSVVHYKVGQNLLNKRLVGNVLGTETVDGLHTCIRSCTEVPTCIALNFIRIPGTCELLDFVDNTTIIDQPGTLCATVNDVRNWTGQVCQGDSCPLDYMCFPAGRSYVCEPLVQCVSFKLANGLVNDTSTTVGTVLSVSCDPSFMLQGSSVIECRHDAMWSNYPRCV